MDSDPFFSVIIPTHNRQAFIGTTIQAFLNQTETDFELLIVDDGSTDNTAEVVKSVTDERIRYIPIANSERAVARNTGAAAARGRYVNFFDSDDLPKPNHLAEGRATIDSASNPPWAAVNYEILFRESKRTQPNPRFKPSLREDILMGSTVHINGVFVRRDVAQNNPFDERPALIAAEDWELWLRLAARHPIAYSNQRTYYLVQHPDRSVNAVDKAKLKARMNAVVDCVRADERFQAYFGPRQSRVRAFCNAYIALHLALSKRHRAEAFAYWWRAVFSNPRILGRRMMYGTIKHFL
jgi:glycosyltransferase involved in cell wall biosynthesis